MAAGWAGVDSGPVSPWCHHVSPVKAPETRSPGHPTSGAWSRAPAVIQRDISPGPGLSSLSSHRTADGEFLGLNFWES